MRYFGGKNRISKQVSELINSLNPSVYVEPFCGSCWVGERVKAETRVLSDANIWLIEMFTALQAGWIPPGEITEELYAYLKMHKPLDPLTAFAGFGCSYAGKFFGGYARNRGDSPRNYATNARNSLLRRKPNFDTAVFLNADWTEVLDSVDFDIAYLDPPYRGTTNYYGVNFDYEGFWASVRTFSSKRLVLVSEYDAPDDFVSVLDIETMTDIRTVRGRAPRSERLYTWCSGINTSG